MKPELIGNVFVGSVLAAMCTLQVAAGEFCLEVPEAGTRAVRRVDPKGAHVP